MRPWPPSFNARSIREAPASIAFSTNSLTAAAGRSMTFAMAVAAGFFPLDNFLGYVLPILQNATQERIWSDLTTYLLGPTLNHLPAVLMGRRAGELIPPQLPVDAAHSLLVVAGYAVAVSAAAAVMVRRRDTLE